MTDAYRTALQQLIEMRLGAPAKMRLTTNRNEAANRAISASLPKKLFSRNKQGNLCMVIDRMNYSSKTGVFSVLSQEGVRRTSSKTDTK